MRHPVPHDRGWRPVGFSQKDFESRLAAFAEESVDDRSLTYTSPLADGTTLKLHLLTGELLIVTAGGEVSVYTRLPVGERPVGTYGHTGHFFKHMTETVISPESRAPKVIKYARLTAGEPIAAVGFASPNGLVDHVNKHVLQLPPAALNYAAGAKSRRSMEQRPNVQIEFDVLRRGFALEIEKCAGEEMCEEVAYKALLHKYSKAAEDFAKSKRPSALNYTHMEVRHGLEHVMTYRFDIMSNEFAVIERDTGKVITYYRITTELANRSLRKHSFPSVNSPLEYYLFLPYMPARGKTSTPP